MWKSAALSGRRSFPPGAATTARLVWITEQEPGSGRQHFLKKHAAWQRQAPAIREENREPIIVSQLLLHGSEGRKRVVPEHVSLTPKRGSG